MPLDLQSERYNSTGNIAAEGVQRLLGTPDLDRLHTLLRETVQNSGDAALPDGTTLFQVGLRTLNPDQRNVLQDEVFGELPPRNAGSVQLIRDFLSSGQARVLEISDFGTYGLAGPTRADEVPAQGEPTDFIDFVRNVGSTRDRHLGGGTYGYGKASVYTASACGTVIIDSLTTHRGAPARRLIAAHIGTSYDVESGDRQGRYTGRHWWGMSADTTHLEPVTGEEATRLADALGLPVRDTHDTGTTLMILAPFFDQEEPEELIGHIQEALLWHCWPKMLVRDGEPAMYFATELEGSDVPLPDPEYFPPVDRFIQAYRCIRERAAPMEEIRSQRPARLLGRIAIIRGRTEERHWLVDAEKSAIPRISHHLATMRPAELVVRYYEGAPSSDTDDEWAGVFQCDDDDEIEDSFARSEPPAHDDWIPGYLEPRSRAKTYVRVALREIKSRIAMVGTTPGAHPVNPEEAGLAGAAGILGRILNAEGDQPGHPARPAPGGSRKRIAMSGPVFERLEEGQSGPEAVFRLEIRADGRHDIELEATPRIVTEGGRYDEDNKAPNGRSPEFIRWESESGEALESGTCMATTVTGSSVFLARTSVPDYVAVTLQVGMVEVSDP